MKPIISVEGLGKKYQIKHKNGRGGYRSLREEILQFPKNFFKRSEKSEEFWALKNVSFDVMPGDRVGIIGRNGAGKSTLLKLLSRITEPSVGKITMRGRVASLLEVGTGFHAELTGRENIFLNGAILGMTRREVRKKFDEIVDFSGVEKFLDTPVKRYSSGMYVRLAFAVAAHLESEVLIVDEVLAVGDAAFQKKCLEKMEEVSSRGGRTILFVSHNMGAIKRFCTQGIVLDSGQIGVISDVDTAISSYSNPLDSGDSSGFFLNNAQGTHILSASLENSLGEVTTRFSYGETLLLKLNLSYNECMKHGIELRFKDETGALLAYASSYIADGEHLSISKGKLELCIKLPSLPFVEGRYFIDVILRQPNLLHVENWWDQICFDIVTCSPGESPISVSKSSLVGAVVLPTCQFCLKESSCDVEYQSS